MGRRSSYPTLYEHLKTVSIADLKRFGYLRTGYRSGGIKWTINGETTGDIAVKVWIDETERRGCFHVTYTYDGKRFYNYFLDMVAVPTNLGIGLRWYFICNHTCKRCSKLYLFNEYFQHRSGAAGTLYKSQTRSGFYRLLDKVWNAHDRIYAPYLKTHYRGKPTKRYLKAYQAYAETERLCRLLL